MSQTVVHEMTAVQVADIMAQLALHWDKVGVAVSQIKTFYVLTVRNGKHIFNTINHHETISVNHDDTPVQMWDVHWATMNWNSEILLKQTPRPFFLTSMLRL